MNPQTTLTSGANGHTTLDDIFALTDEQILEVDPEPQDVEVSADTRSGVLSQLAHPNSPAVGATLGSPDPNGTEVGAGGASPSPTSSHDQQPATPANANAAPTPFSSPDDVRALSDLYPGGLTQAKTAAERARLLDDIDRAYFGAAGSTPEQARASRAELAQMMLREDPAAFRELVFEGLRALEQAGGPPPVAAVFRPRGSDANGATASSASANASIVGATLGSPSGESATATSGGASLAPTRLGNHQTAQRAAAAQQAHLAAYAEFEKAANADLEKTVGSSIERALHHALPHSDRAESAALTARLSAAIRQDVEKALQGDRQLGEQVAQILAGRSFDHETRAQVVRLINDRAQQLVPGAAKRALHDWTQATLAAHRARNDRADGAASRREVATAAAAPIPRDLSSNTRSEAARSSANAGQSRPSSKSRFDYRRLSDEQILDL